jgi:hypothetical protein
VATDPPAADAVVSRGWRVSVTGWDHVIELGRPPLGLQLSRSFFLDDRLLVRRPLLVPGGDWRHEFRLDGRAATLRTAVTGDGEDARVVVSLEVDGHDLGPPVEIVGPPDRRATATAADRRRARRIVMGLLCFAGLAMGSVVPFASESRRGPILIVLAGGFLLAGLIGGAAAAIALARGSRARWPRLVLQRLLPFDVGLVAGLAAVTALGGPDRDDLGRVVAGVLAVPLGVLLGALGVAPFVGLARGAGRPARGRVRSAGILLASAGLAAMGTGLVVGAMGQLAVPPLEAPGIVILFVGVGVLVAGSLLILVSPPEAAPGTAWDGSVGQPLAPLAVMGAVQGDGDAASIARAIDELCRFPDRGFAIVAGARGYVQLTPVGGALYGEAVSDAYLEPERRLFRGEVLALEALGWRVDVGSDQNFQLRLPEPIELPRTADLVIQTLAVYGDHVETIELG